MIHNFTKMFLGQLIIVGLVTWNFRMIAIGNIGIAVLSEIIWASSNFWYLKYLVRDESKAGWAGYVGGCAVGTFLALRLTMI